MTLNRTCYRKVFTTTNPKLCGFGISITFHHFSNLINIHLFEKNYRVKLQSFFFCFLCEQSLHGHLINLLSTDSYFPMLVSQSLTMHKDLYLKRWDLISLHAFVFILHIFFFRFNVSLSLLKSFWLTWQIASKFVIVMMKLTPHKRLREINNSLQNIYNHFMILGPKIKSPICSLTHRRPFFHPKIDFKACESTNNLRLIEFEPKKSRLALFYLNLLWSSTRKDFYFY